MVNENGTWVMYGVDRDDLECIHTVEEAYAGDLSDCDSFAGEKGTWGEIESVEGII